MSSNCGCKQTKPKCCNPCQKVVTCGQVKECCEKKNKCCPNWVLFRGKEVIGTENIVAGIGVLGGK